jgi:small subunit ribosomal protein S12
MMANLYQSIIKSRTKKSKKTKAPKLRSNPQKKAICLRVLTISPKKPNSANRAIVKATITQFKTKISAKIQGENHNLQQHATILIRGGKIHDLIGVNYCVIRAKYDLVGVINRKTKRSIYGIKKN